MKKILLFLALVGAGALVFAAYHFFSSEQTETPKESEQQKQTIEISAESERKNLLSGDYLKKLGEEHYRSGIDTVLLIDGDTYFLKDLSNELHFVESQTDKNAHTHEHGNNHEFWRYYLSKPHPNVAAVEKYFKDASEEFGVPVEILQAIGQVENNWTQIGPSIDQGWGIMHLVDNNYCKTLLEASQMLNLPSQELKDNAKENIRGAAALLASYAGNNRGEFTSYEEWHPAMKKFSGLINENIQSLQLEEYLRVLHKGSKTVTLWGEEIILEPQPAIYKK